jgi:hypothetical protein
VHVAPACVGSGEGSDNFGSYVHNISSEDPVESSLENVENLRKR